MRHVAALASCILAVVLAASAIGCGEASNGIPIRGHVSYQGQPIVHGSVMFFPARGRPTVAATDAEGDYAVELAPGDYAVTLSLSVRLPAGWKEGDPVPPQSVKLPTEYTTRVNTPLKATISAGGNEPIDFVLP